MSSHYSPSGRIDPVRTSGALVFSTILLALVSYVYNAVLAWMPFIYLSVIIVIAYAMGIGLLTKLVMRIGKYRSKQLALATAALLGVIALYTQWMAFLAYVANDYSLSFTVYLGALLGGLNLPNTFGFISEINEFGTWGVGFSGDNTVNGAFLTVIWVLEAALLIGYPVYATFLQSLPPYSEDQDRFFDEHVLQNNFQSLLSGVKATEGLRSDALAYLRTIELASGYPFCQVIVYTLPREREAYISIHRIRLDEKSNEVAVPVVEYLAISGAAAREVLDAYANDKESVKALLD